MNMNRTHFWKWPAYSAITIFFWLATFASAQSMPTQTRTQNDDSRSAQDRDTQRQELARFDQFLDQHREIAEQLRKDPSLVNDNRWVKNHPALQSYLREHPAVRQDLTQNPTAFMDREERDDQHFDRDRNRQELARFDQFLDAHRQIDRELRKNPSLVNDQKYLSDHPDLQAYLQNHPQIREDLTRNPKAFMQREDRYDDREAYRNDRDNDVNRDRDRDRDNANSADRDATRDNDRGRDADRRDADDNRSDRDDMLRRDRDASPDNNVRRADRDANHQEMANFDKFLDAHREEGEQIRKNPALLNNQQFLSEHPAVRSYLQQHPGVRDELRDNPNAFSQQQAENRYGRSDYMNGTNGTQGSMGRGDRDDHVASFRQFLGAHSEVSEQLSKDPTLVKNPSYLQSHPELQSYLNAHPEVRQELMANPQHFIQSTQQPHPFNNPQPTGPGGVKTPTSPTTDPTKPKQ